MIITIDTSKWITQKEYADRTGRTMQSVGNDIRKKAITVKRIPELYLTLIDVKEVENFLARKRARA